MGRRKRGGRPAERLPRGSLVGVEHFAKLAEAVAGAHHLDQILHAFSEQMPNLLPFHRTSISVVTDEQRISWHLLRGEPVAEIVETSSLRPGSLVDRVMRLGEMVVIPAIGRSEPPFEEEHELLAVGSRSMVACPLRLRGRTIGVINIESDRPAAYRADDEPIVKLIASQIAVALERFHLFQAQEQKLQDVGQQLTRAGQLATVGQLAAVVAHEVKNRFNTILIAARLLERRLAEAHRADDLPLVGSIVRSVEQGTSLMREFLRVASPATPRCVAFPLRAVLEEAVNLGTRPNIRVVWDVPAGLPRVWADPNQLGQVFLNLVLNAVEAMPGGGTLRVAARPRSDAVEVRVSDTGGGIPADNLERIFQPFFTTKASGTGLGMSISKSIVEGNGGQIAVSSAPGRGTTFTLRLPAHAERAKAG